MLTDPEHAPAAREHDDAFTGPTAKAEKFFKKLRAWPREPVAEPLVPDETTVPDLNVVWNPPSAIRQRTIETAVLGGEAPY